MRNCILFVSTVIFFCLNSTIGFHIEFPSLLISVGRPHGRFEGVTPVSQVWKL